MVDPYECSILVVDDDHDAAHNLGDILVDLGFKVAVATDGIQALELARKERYQIALLDLKMPGMDGLTLSQKLKEINPAIVAILTTAYANQDKLALAHQSGIWRVFPKPLDLGVIIPCLVEVSQRPLVLLVEDDPDLCHSLTDVLQDKGFRVCFATETPQALNLLRDTDFQVVLIDMKLPGAFGDDVYRDVRGISQRARVVLVTGHRHEMEERIQRSLDAGADAVCYKPFEIPELLRLLQRLTEEPNPSGVA